MRHRVMSNENIPLYLGEPNVRITRLRAKALGPSVDDKVSRTTSKRAATCSSVCPQLKKRTALKDVSNITHQNGDTKCRGQHSNSKKEKVPPGGCLAKKPPLPRVSRGNKSQKTDSEKNLTIEAATFVSKKTSELCKIEKNLEDKGIINIDSRHKDVQMCSLYAADIYSFLYATQYDRRPLVDYMEKVQRDITAGMRATLIDWLVDVSQEYKLAADTLYLAVNLIDRFLSGNCIEKPKLQLLGVTCMLIASKYEEVCVPSVEHFCFITDNTYTKEEVVKMESRVLNLLDFQLFVPTTKKFLRRFVQAAQVSYKVPCAESEFLANYLVELTLIEYSFLKFVSSSIAASAVFLARWTLDQSQHPWNPTLEHYTRYKASDLKDVVLELQDLQLDTKGCTFHAIRRKYNQPKFKYVSTLRPSKSVNFLF